MDKLRLLLLDDHTLFRESLCRLLESEPDLVVAAQFDNPEAALEAIGVENPGLVLLDYDLGDTTGLAFLRAVRAKGYAGRILMLTAGMSEADYVRTLGFGVSGIFLKHSSPILLLEAIRKVANGETWIDPRCVDSLIKAVEDTPDPVSRDLTTREQEVLRRIFEGLANKEIAAQLRISEASVKSTLQQLFHKMGVRTRSQLVRVALEQYGHLWR